MIQSREEIVMGMGLHLMLQCSLLVEPEQDCCHEWRKLLVLSNICRYINGSDIKVIKHTYACASSTVPTRRMERDTKVIMKFCSRYGSG